MLEKSNGIAHSYKVNTTKLYRLVYGRENKYYQFSASVSFRCNYFIWLNAELNVSKTMLLKKKQRNRRSRFFSLNLEHAWNLPTN